MQPTYGPEYAQAAAMEYMKRRALADAIARGITIPQMGAGQPALPESMSAQPAPPPYWPGVQPQAQSVPQGGQPTPASVPQVQVPEGAASGATTSPVLPQGRLARVMQVLQNPQMQALLMNAGQSLGGPRMPGESQMQQIGRSMSAGVQGAQGALQQQRGMLQADWQRGMEERKQGTSEATAASDITARAAETERGKGQLAVNKTQAEGNLKLGQEGLAQRKVESADEKAWKGRQAEIQEAAQTGDWARHADLMGVHKQQLDNDAKKLKFDEARVGSAVKLDQLQTSVALKRAQLDVLVAQAHMYQIAQETKDPRAKAKMDATARIYGSMASTVASDVRSMAGKSPAEVAQMYKGVEKAAIDAGEAITEAAYPTKDKTAKPTSAKYKVGDTVTYKGKPHRVKGILSDGNYDLEEVK